MWDILNLPGWQGVVTMIALGALSFYLMLDKRP